MDRTGHFSISSAPPQQIRIIVVVFGHAVHYYPRCRPLSELDYRNTGNPNGQDTDVLEIAPPLKTTVVTAWANDANSGFIMIVTA